MKRCTAPAPKLLGAVVLSNESLSVSITRHDAVQVGPVMCLHNVIAIDVSGPATGW